MTKRMRDLGLALFLGACGCQGVMGEPPHITVESVVHVTSDDGEPLAGAELVVGSATLATTSGDGTARLRLTGFDGERRAVQVRCPADHQAPTSPTTVLLRPMTEPSQRLRYDVVCTPLKRRVVVAVHVQNGPNLPITHWGREIARTDAAGFAHARLLVPAGESFELSVDTSSDARLEPPSPSVEFTVGHEDELVVFEPRLVVRPPRVIHRPRAGRRPKRL